jgi:asparagine synthase (glutamine-hydrolysing)
VNQLLAGSAGGRGLVGVFDPAGPDPRRFRAVSVPEGIAPAESPMVRVVINGEIFNLGELADELGILPASSVEAVLAAGYERWSRNLLARLRGSFALVVIDEREHRALIAADQAGGHSIYFHAAGERLEFASEVHLLLGLLPVRPAPDAVGVVHWFSDFPPPVGRTLYEGVHELRGGECFELSPAGWSRSDYWALRYEPPPALSQAEAADLLWASLVRAVESRLGESENVGLVMSAGVDSSAVAAAAVAVGRESGSTLRGYSAVFPGDPDERVDESERIDQLVAGLGLRNTQVRIEPGGSFALSLDWLEAWELPLGGPGHLVERPLLELAAADGVDALLDGQGGDEGFAVSSFWLADLLRAGRLASSLRMARRLPEGSSSWRGLYDEWRLYALRGAIPLRLHAAYRRSRNPYRHAPRFLTPESARLHVETDEVWDWKRRRGVPRWWAERSFLLTADRQAVGLGGYLRRRATLTGLKARPPLLDPDLIACLLRIPPELGFDPDLDRPLIRRGMEGRVPDAVRLSTRKSHLGPFFYDVVAGPDLEPIRRLFRLPQPEIGAYARIDAVRRMLDSPPGPADGNRLRWMIDVWRLATAECWLRYHEDPSIVETLRDRPLPQPRWTIHRNAEP